MSDQKREAGTPEDRRSKDDPKGKPANAAPDAVMDPNEKTEGRPGMGPGGEPKGGSEKKPGDDADPGGG